MGDTEEIIKCPACDNEMQKIFITDKGINIDVCSNGCGGIFFDNKEIQEFSDKNADISEIKRKSARVKHKKISHSQSA